MKLILTNVRLSFPSIWEFAQYKGKSQDRFEATFLVEKGTEQAKAVQDAVKSVGAAKFGEKWAQAGLPLHDGDKKDYEGYAGHWSLKAATKKRPVILDRDKSVLQEQDGRPYAGCYVNASVTLSAYTNDYGDFISCQLNGIQFARDGDAFGGGEGYSDDDFGAVDSGDNLVGDAERVPF